MEPTVDSTSSTNAVERVVLGRVVGAHGIEGQIRVRYFGGAPDNLLGLEVALLVECESDASPRSYEVVRSAAGRRGEVRMALAGIETRDAAQRLRGRLLVVEAAALEALPEGEYYGFQLVGCELEGADGRRIGTVREVWPTGAVDVLVVEGDAGERHLIPADERQLREVDIDARRIVIEILPGLLGPA